MVRTPLRPWAALLLICAAVSGLAQQPLPKPQHPLRSGPKGKATPKLVDINSAAKEELKTLPGIDEELAARIVKGRPYKTKAHLVTQKVLPMPVYQAIRQAIRARQPGEPK